MPWLKTRPVEGRGSFLFPPRCCSRRRCGGPRPRGVAAALSELSERCDARLGQLKRGRRARGSRDPAGRTRAAGLTNPQIAERLVLRSAPWSRTRVARCRSSESATGTCSDERTTAAGLDDRRQCLRRLRANRVPPVSTRVGGCSSRLLTSTGRRSITLFWSHTHDHLRRAVSILETYLSHPGLRRRVRRRLLDRLDAPDVPGRPRAARRRARLRTFRRWP